MVHLVTAVRAPCAVVPRACFTSSAPRFQSGQRSLRQAAASIAQRRSVAVRGASKYSNIEQVDAEQLEAEILNRDRPLIIDFYATWCGPCVLLAKELETVAEKMGDAVRILKIDTDKNPDISTQLQIHGLPTLIFVGMDASKPALRTEGLLPAQVIQEIVERDLVAGGSSDDSKLLQTYVQQARKQGVPPKKLVPWVRRKLGGGVVIWRYTSDGGIGCAAPCLFCSRELQRFDLLVDCALGGGSWFHGRLSEPGAPKPQLTGGQQKVLRSQGWTLCLDPKQPTKEKLEQQQRPRGATKKQEREWQQRSKGKPPAR